MKKQVNVSKKSCCQALLLWLKKDGPAWLMIAPLLIIGIVFVFEPLIVGIKTSFFETRGFECVKFVGFENYKDIMTDSVFIKAMLNTVKYALWSIVLGLFVPVVVAVALNEIIHGKGFFRFATYFPCILPGVVTAVMWVIMFDPGNGGVLNYLRSFMGLPALQWLNDPKMTIQLIVVTMTWGGFGSTAILYLADLQSINTDLYEAISLDGGGIWAKLRTITIPHMSGMIKMLFIMQIISVFQIFYQPLTMTGGGPNNASISLTQVAYNYAFKTMEIGRSTATSVVTSLMIMIFSIFYMKIKSKNMSE